MITLIVGLYPLLGSLDADSVLDSRTNVTSAAETWFVDHKETLAVAYHVVGQARIMSDEVH